MAVGKGSIQRATRTLKDENKDKVTLQEKDVLQKAAEETAATAPVKESGEAAEQSTEKPAEAAEKKAPAKRGRKPGSKNKTVGAAAAKTAKKKAPAGTAAKTAKRKTSAGTAAKASPKNTSSRAKAAAKVTQKKSYEQVSHIQSALPVHLL